MTRRPRVRPKTPCMMPNCENPAVLGTGLCWDHQTQRPPAKPAGQRSAHIGLTVLDSVNPW